MKKLLLTLLLLTSIGYVAQAQILFDFDVEVETKVKNGETIANVTIILNTGELPINYIIVNGTLSNMDALVESGFSNKTKYKFKDIPAGQYLVKIEDKQGLSASKPLIITEE